MKLCVHSKWTHIRLCRNCGKPRCPACLARCACPSIAKNCLATISAIRSGAASAQPFFAEAVPQQPQRSALTSGPSPVRRPKPVLASSSLLARPRCFYNDQYGKGILPRHFSVLFMRCIDAR